MKLTLEINNLTKSPIQKAFFKAVAEKTLEKSGYKFLNPPAGGKNISVSLAIVGKAEMKKLNKTYRKKNESTDILSFAEYKNIQEIKAAKETELFLGELILCYDDIKEYTRKYGLNFQKETGAVVSHGILHLLGFRHGKKMFGIQKDSSIQER
ncbi:MAG: rRNA maturation RNase YbeY [Candidatus Moranbacteria bacterium CG_4_9_14_3_um_filter_42_9]|nr:MAG: rRNA maturation RNase YbeY [Candidatus Moranbacteria bacterium CG_4_9_14_3_um_filter_42_9]